MKNFDQNGARIVMKMEKIWTVEEPIKGCSSRWRTNRDADGEGAAGLFYLWLF